MCSRRIPIPSRAPPRPPLTRSPQSPVPAEPAPSLRGLPSEARLGESPTRRARRARSEFSSGVRRLASGETPDAGCQPARISHFSSAPILIPPCVILMHFASSGAGKRRKSRTVESVGRQGGNGRRFGGRITARAMGGTPARSGGGGPEVAVNKLWESVGNAKPGSNPLDTPPPLLYPRPRRNPPWRGPHPAAPKKVSKSCDDLGAKCIYGGEGPRPAPAEQTTEHTEPKLR